MSKYAYMYDRDSMSGKSVVEMRAELCREAITLNGLEARIKTPNADYAYIVQRSTGLGCEWAWATVARIVDLKNGEFAL